MDDIDSLDNYLNLEIDEKDDGDDPGVKESFKLDEKIYSPIAKKFLNKRERSPKSKFFTKPKTYFSEGCESTKKRTPSDFQKINSENQVKSFNKNFDQLKSDFLILEGYEKTFFKDTTLDLMFIMDITGSMGMWLTEAKTKITNIMTDIAENNPCSKIRVSFVGYRDFTESSNPRGQYVNIDFSENIQEVKDFVSTIEAYGGGDEPEDIAGALDQALKMKWESNARYAVLVCDAPCHGKQYHKIIYDKYSEGDPTGLVMEDLLNKFVEKNITLYAIEINDSTKMMFDLFTKIYEKSNKAKFHTEKLNNSNQFAFFVAFSASETLGNITYNVVKLEEVIRNFRNDIIKKISQKYLLNNKNIYNNNSDDISEDLINHLNELNLEEEEKSLFSFINRMNNLSLNKDSSSSNYNDHGGMNIDNDNNNEDNNEIDVKLSTDSFHINQYYPCTCHYLSIKTSEQSILDWVYPNIQHNKIDSKFNIDNISNLQNDEINNKYKLKIYDYFLDKSVNCLIDKSIQEKYLKKIDLYLHDRFINGAICQLMADSFNLRVADKMSNSKSYIKFANEILYEINNNSNINYPNFPCKYLVGKVVNNPFTVITLKPLNKQTLDAFSHFSFQYSEGNLIITDMVYDQNNNAIISYDIKNVSKEGQCGIMNFFVSHFCNDICRKLELIHPRKKNSEIKITQEFYYFNTICNGKLCELCKLPIKDNDEFCSECSEKIKITEKKGVCVECHKMFNYSCYYYSMKMINYPNKCFDCTFSF